ncbi:MAG: amino acid racemase, partial [Pseudomonadota bacterium]
MTLPRIGILGGMGPAATILLQQRVLEAVPARSDDDHIPLLIDMNPQVPSRISYLIHNRGQNPGPVLAKMARGLEASGVDAIAMPCCTAHLFAAEISSAVTVPFLNMVRLTAAEIARRVPNGARIGILASPATEKTGLYKSALSPHDLQPLFPKEASQMLGAIEAIKSKGPCPASIATVQEAIHELSQEGVAAFIVGCSEFSLMSR